MTHKSSKIAQLIEGLRGGDLDPHYLGFFECFNKQLYFEAHEVLEELWLAERGRPEDLYYKGLIQVAGAFVHVQKQRPGPAAALLRLARQNLERYSSPHQRLDVAALLRTIDTCLQRLHQAGIAGLALEPESFPRLVLNPAASSDPGPRSTR